MTDEDDRIRLARTGEGSESAFNQLLDEHQAALRSFLRNLLGNDADADDVAQETFLAAWTMARSFAGHASVRTWLFAIAWRQAKMAQRGWGRQRRRDRAYAEFRETHGPLEPPPDDGAAIREALAGLPLDQRAAIVLCLGCGMTHKEAAESLGAPVGTIKSHIARGRARLQEALGDD
jgi:RNA polymerase sigma factor (sigma-70 family)